VLFSISMTPRTATLLTLLLLTPLGVSSRAQSPADLPDAPIATNVPGHEPVPTNPTIIIDTTMGRVTCKTFPQFAPNAVANFIGLAEGTKDWIVNTTSQKMHGARFYDGLTFHRVIPGFMVQAGDPMGDGSGDPGYYFPDEVSPALTFSVPGRLAMANSGPNTNGSQFFITEAPQPDLDGRYTIFGQCDVHSVLITSSIARVPRDRNDKPLTPVLITRVTIIRDGQEIPPLPAAPPATAPTTPPPAPTTP
jgi:peptidyl-prolyl cis-trans isomerase A (cyclophilin A)